MADRVNLSIPADVIKQAKIYALEQGKSLSTIVEEFLRQLLIDGPKEKMEDEHEPKKTGIDWIDELRGSVKDTGESYDDMKWDYLRNKYLK